MKNVTTAKSIKKMKSSTGNSRPWGSGTTLAVFACRSIKRNTFQVPHMIGT
jgi:hypothetical protein